MTIQIENTQSYFFVGVIKGVNRITCWFTPLFAERERERSGHLYKITKDLYQIISKLSEHQEVTDIIWYDILFIDNLGSNTPWEKVGQTVGQFLGGQKHLHYFITCEVLRKYFTISKSGSKSGSNLNVCTLAYSVQLSD